MSPSPIDHVSSVFNIHEFCLANVCQSFVLILTFLTFFVIQFEFILDGYIIKRVMKKC